MTRRVDVHHHILPREYVDALGADVIGGQSSAGRLPDWSVEGSLALMDDAGIDTAIVSISAPALAGLAPDVAARVARDCNELAREMADAHPGRFGLFATVPLPSVEAASAEVEYALDTLGADGVCLLSNYAGRYLDDPALRPLLAELDRRAAVVFVHPTSPAQRVDVAGASPSLLEFPFETTRALTSLLLGGVLTAFPAIDWIFAHAGGTLPYLIGRFEVLLRNNPQLRAGIGGDVREVARRVHYDLALSYDDIHLRALRTLVDDERIVFGSDYPFGPPGQMSDAARSLDGLALGAATLQAIASGNADRLFPRRAPRHEGEPKT